MTAPNWKAIKSLTPRNPLMPFKVIPTGLPSWDDNADRDYFFTQKDAETEAADRNNSFTHITLPIEGVEEEKK